MANILLKILKDIADVVSNWKFTAIVDLRVREQILELREVNLKLQEENSKLEESLLDQGSMVFEKNVYYKINADGKKEGPFCS